jgi:DNA-binding NarL/FixJ family response regulator
MSAGTRVLIADDHPGILSAVSKYLARRGYDVVALAPNGDDAVREIEKHHPEVALVDIRMPGLDGAEVTRRAARVSPETKIIAFSGYGGTVNVMELLDAGAHGFLMKDAALAEVLRAVEVVARGGTYVDPTQSPPVSSERPALDQRERDVLRLLAAGNRYEEVGAKLYVSTATVRKVVAKIRIKLGAETATEAVAIAIRDALIA